MSMISEKLSIKKSLGPKNGITNYIYLRNSSTNSFYRYVGENGAKAQMAPILY
jgi:hypothetical protein